MQHIFLRLNAWIPKRVVEQRNVNKILLENMLVFFNKKIYNAMSLMLFDHTP